MDVGKIKQRISKNSITDGDCILWTGQMVNGSAVIKIDGQKRPVARVVWALYRTDDLPSAIFRSCGKRECVNPWHLSHEPPADEDEASVAPNWDWASDERFIGWVSTACRKGVASSKRQQLEVEDVLQEALIWLSERRPRRDHATARAAASEGLRAARRAVRHDLEVDWVFAENGIVDS